MTVEEAKVFTTLDEIAELDDIEVEDLFVPMWNGSVKIRSITKRQFREIKRSAIRPGEEEADNDLVEQGVFCSGMVQPTVDAAGYERLLDKSAAAIDFILGRILKISNLTKKAQEELEKKFLS